MFAQLGDPQRDANGGLCEHQLGVITVSVRL